MQLRRINFTGATHSVKCSFRQVGYWTDSRLNALHTDMDGGARAFRILPNPAATFFEHIVAQL